jgi:BTB/POZ domain-containing protein KCTD9
MVSVISWHKGIGLKDFHSKCDGHSNTLTIIKAKESEFIFGGFTSVSWESSAYGKFKSDPYAFIFSLTNKDNQPLKMKIDPNQHKWAILCYSSYGPMFGYCDINIDNNANTTMNSYSFLGSPFKHPQYAYGTNEARTFLAGSYKFQLNEIEIYQIEEE